MLTPSFELSQNDLFLIISIKAPFAKVAETEIFIEEDEFRFFSKPYFLRLCLPGHIVEDGRESADYDVDTGIFTIKVPKAEHGRHFEGLDMITKLLTPKGNKSAAQPLIEVLDSSERSCEESHDSEEEFDWHIEQEQYVDTDITLSSSKYGFANMKSGMFQRLQEEVKEIIDLPDPDNQPVTDRRLLRTAAELEKFDADYYLADLYEDEGVQEVIKYKAFWEIDEFDSSKQIQFSEKEKDKMKNLPKKEYVIEESSLVSVYLGLVDIIFAFAYNHRTTEGENNVESDWTLCKLCSTMSWFEVFHDINEVVMSCARRSLCYPLYRNWQLTEKVLSDTHTILSQGRKQVLKCLLEVREILSHSYPYYILNELYVTDYSVWIQSASEKRLKSLADNLHQISIKKADVGFGICEVEEASKCDIEENKDVENVTDVLSHVHLDSKTKNSTLLNVEQIRDSDDDTTEGESEDSEDTESAEDDTESESADTESVDEDTETVIDKNTNTDKINTETYDKNTKTDDKNSNIDDKNTKTDDANTETDDTQKLNDKNTIMDDKNAKTDDNDSKIDDKNRDTDNKITNTSS